MKRNTRSDFDESEAKKSRHDEVEELVDFSEMDECKDVFLTLKLLRKMIEPSTRFSNIPPVILKHMMYSVMDNHTEIEKTIADLGEKRKIRQFYLNGVERDKIVYLFTEDYIALYTIVTQNYKQRQIQTLSKHDGKILPDSKKKRVETTSEYDFDGLFSKVVGNLLPNWSDFFVTISRLKQLVDTDDIGMNHLMKMGMFTLRDEESLWFAIPNAGTFISSLETGKKEILNILSRKKFKEILLRDLYRKTIRGTVLTTQFLVREMVTSGKIIITNTTNGSMITLNNK